jgi:THO complex subunit 3
VQTNNIVFCWSGQRIFATTGDGSVRILSFPEFEPAYKYDYKDGIDAEFSLAGHTSSCIVAEIHPTYRYLASGGTDSLIALWETSEWNCQRTITKMTGPVRSLSTSAETMLKRCMSDTRFTGFSWDGLYIVGGSDEGESPGEPLLPRR